MKESNKPRRSVIQYIFCVLVVFAILLLRQSGELAQPPIIWEDGTLFLSDACMHPAVTNLFSTYVGYVHLLPRIIAEIASQINLHHAPLLFRLSSVLVAAMAISFPITSLFRNVLPITISLLLILLTTLAPWHAETLGNIASIHWYLFYALALLSLADTRHLRSWGVSVALVFCFIAVFSSPLCVLTVPVFLWRLIRTDTTKQERLIDAGVLFMISAMLIYVKVIMAAHGTPQGIAEVSNGIRGIYLFTVKALGYKVIGVTTLGQLGAARHLESWLLSYVAIAAFTIGSLTLWILRLTAKAEILKDKRPNPLLLLYYILAPIVFTGIMRPHYVKHFVDNNTYFGADRYFLIPGYILILFALLLVYHLFMRFPTWWTKILFIIWICIYAVIIHNNFFYPVTPDYGWQEEISKYYAMDAGHKDSGEEPHVIVLPHDPPWRIQLPRHHSRP